MTKSYAEDAASAYADILEEGTLAVMEWETATEPDPDTGEKEEGDPMSATVSVVILPSGGGDRFEDGHQVRNFRRKFIAVPTDPAVEILNGRFITVGSQKYAIESSAPLAPSGSDRILWEGTLKIGG